MSASFLYFLPDFPGQLASSVDHLPEMLRPVLRDCAGAWENTRVTAGPDGRPGLVISPMPARRLGAPEPTPNGQVRCGYYPDDQQWTQVSRPDDAPSHWIGRQSGTVIGPDDLLRGDPLDGQLVRLADGNEWLIPSVHPLRNSLPKQFVMGPNRQVEIRTKDGYEQIQAESEKWIERVTGGGQFLVTEWFDYCARLLALNYRVGIDEVCLLEILGDTERIRDQLIAASVGVLDQLEEIDAKKKGDIAPSGSVASPGAEDSTPNTSPAGPISSG